MFSRIKRDEEIWDDFVAEEKKGYKSGVIYMKLAEKYYLSPFSVRDIVGRERGKERVKK